MNKVLLITVDAMRPDAVNLVPEAHDLMKKSTYTLKATTVMPSVTLPCHLSMFLSVDPERHGTTINSYAPQVRPIDGLCEILHNAGKKCAFFYSWAEFRDLTRPGSLDYSEFINAKEPTGDQTKDRVVTKKLVDNTINYINEENPDFTWLYIGWPDHVGHHYYWMSETYVQAVENCWKEISRVINSIPDYYTVIINADHGGHGGYHGTDAPEDMLIPVFAKGPEFEMGREFRCDVNIKDIAPTITELLGVEPNPEWRGKSFLKK